MAGKYPDALARHSPDCAAASSPFSPLRITKVDGDDNGRQLWALLDPLDFRLGVAGVARGTVRNRKAGYRAHLGDVKQRTPRCPECGRAITETPCRACQIERGLTKPALEIVPAEGV